MGYPVPDQTATMGMLLLFSCIILDLYRRCFDRGYRSYEPIDPAIFRKVKIDGGKYQNTTCKVRLNELNQKLNKRNRPCTATV